jgi:heterodisulfide reductase subunit A
MTKNQISIEINGKNVEVEEGTTVFEAAEKLEIRIPNLCAHKTLLPYGACRLCLVEISQSCAPASIQTSCTYPVSPGLVVCTDSEKVLATRKIIMELLLARCPGSEQVKSLAIEMGVGKIRIKPQDKDCILCGLCVRMCEERMGRAAINFTGRGQAKEVASPFGKPNELCQACGACDFICPTKKIICSSVSKVKPVSIRAEFNAGLHSRPAVYLLYPQAVPNKATIDEKHCVHLVTGKCGICQEICEAQAIDYEQKAQSLKINAGALVLTSGVKLFDANRKKEYGYDRYDNVITSIEFERILSSSGPTAGEVLRPSDGRPPKKIAFIQCTGSRDPSVGNEFCSSVCCMYSIKEAAIAKEHDPEIEATIYYIDIRSFGKDFERYYESAKKKSGVKFVRCGISKIYETPKSKNLMVKFIESGKMKEAEFDMVVLAVGLNCSDGIRPLGEKLGISINEYGFINSDKYNPCATNREGVFAAGTIFEPKDIPESVSEGSAVAALASSFLKEVRDTLSVKKEYPAQRDISGEDPRIGVFVCRCGRNIASVVNVPEVVKYAAQLDGVVYATEFLYSCSQDALENIKSDITKYGINRVVIASCTPRTHEELFRDTVREAGLNRYLLEMTSLREQVSWVHKDYPEEATQKSKELVSMMVAKTRRIKPLERGISEVIHSALVIGGGASGMQAALTIAGGGYDVFLIEKEDDLGGHLRELFNNLDNGNPQEFMRSLKERVYANERIQVMTGSQMKKLSGFMGNYKSMISCGTEGKEISHGVVVVATGAVGYSPQNGEFGYQQSLNMITQVSLEERLARGPEEFSQPKKFVMIQCVGSRDDEHPYCSRVCCGQAIKNAIRLKKINPGHEIIVLYRDIRTYGFTEKYYLEARELGVIFLCFDAESKPEVSIKNNTITVIHQDSFLQSRVVFTPDLLVLSTGITPGDNQELASILKVPLNADGFFLEAHPKIRPLDFTSEGIFLCGLAHSPRFLSESLIQAQGAAMRSITVLSKDKVEAKANTACVSEKLCRGCGLCVSVCPFEAREIDEETKTAKVIEILCQGCGACAVACPSGATTHKGFSKNQIMAMVEEATDR